MHIWLWRQRPRPGLTVACGTATTIACFRPGDAGSGFCISIDAMQAQEAGAIKKF